MKFRLIVGIAAMLALPPFVLAQENPMARDSKSSRDEGIDLLDIIERFAKRTGKKIVIDPRVRAKVNLAGIDANQVTWDELLAILDVNYFAAVDLHGLITIVPDANARQFPTPIYANLNFKAADREIVTVLLDVKNACSLELVPLLRPLMPQAAHMAASTQTNTLILSDDAANVRRVAQVVELLDRAAPAAQKCKDRQKPNE
jgi:general secretion pathway protein D